MNFAYPSQKPLKSVDRIIHDHLCRHVMAHKSFPDVMFVSPELRKQIPGEYLGRSLGIVHFIEAPQLPAWTIMSKA